MCHLCPANGRADPRCLTCPGPSDAKHNAGQSFISADEVADVLGGAVVVTDAPQESRWGALADILRTLLELTPAQFLVTAGRMMYATDENPAYSYPALGRRLGISTQAAEQLHAATLRRWPVLQTAFRRKIHKRLIRRPAV